LAENLIVEIEPAKRKKGWFELKIRGRPPFLIDEETIFRNGLKAGDIISDPRLRSMKEEADLAWLKYRGMQILSRRMLSERDLRRKLSDERKPAELRDKAMSKLKEYGFYDDSIYAAAYIRSQMAHGIKSRLYLKKKLWEKGISQEISDSVIDKEFESFDEESAVRELASKKLRTLSNLPPEKARNRLVNFLRNRGFSWDLIRDAVDEAMAREREDQ
jgi:regulatory protein